MIIRLLTLVALSVFVTGCLKTRAEVAKVEDRKPMQQSTATTPVLVQKADQEVRIQDLEASMRTLNGRLEVIEQRLNLDMQGRQQDSIQSQATQKQIIEQLKIFEQQLNSIEARMRDLETRKPVAAAPAPPSGPRSTIAPGDDPVEYLEAEKQFADKDWKRAIISYQTYRDNNPKGKQYADATYKIGVSFQELGKKDEAKVFYDEVVEKFPKSPTARKAQYRLKQLK